MSMRAGAVTYRGGPRWLAVFLFAFACGLVSGMARAAEADSDQDQREQTLPQGYAMRFGALYTDNIDRIPENERDELIQIFEVDADTSYEGPRFSGMLDTTLGYRHYTQDRYDDEPRGTLLASADWMISPRRFRWSVSDLLANAPIDPLENITPGNLQFVNAFQTGPVLSTQIGQSQQLDVGLNYAMVNAEESEIDHSRRAGYVNWTTGRRMGKNFGVSLSGQSTDFENDTQNIDFDQRTAYLTHSSLSETLDLNFAAGASRVRAVSGFEQDHATGYMRLDFQRSRRSTLNISLEREVTDTTAALLEVVRSRERLSPSIVVGEPFLSEYATLRYSRGTGLSVASLFAGWRRIDFFDFEPVFGGAEPLDQLQRQAGLELGAGLSSRFSAAASAVYTEIDYTNISRMDDLREFVLRFDYRMNRRWALVLSLMRFELESTDAAQAFTANQGLLYLQYTSRGQRDE